MKIYLIDNKYQREIKRLQLDFEKIMIQAEQYQDTFSGALKTLVKEIEMEINDVKVCNQCYLSIEKYLRKYAASGYMDEPLQVFVEITEGVRLNKMVDVLTSFEEVVKLPNPQFQERYDRLVGLDNLKKQVQREASVLIAPKLLIEWSTKFHNKNINALQTFKDRYPFLIFEGDVGTGKTEFAETFGNTLANTINRNVWLARISMKSRGNGVVGEMSKLITKAFQEAKQLASKEKTPVILLLDEADSLAQSREESQMHHEDRAGVNALIQGIDHIRESTLPILVIFCTNRGQAIDPAIRRRAAIIHTFSRPNYEQRFEVFRKNFSDLSLSHYQIEELTKITGDKRDRNYGFTYSDLLTRLIPQAILSAYPDKKLTFDILLETAQKINPVAPFKDQ